MKYSLCRKPIWSELNEIHFPFLHDIISGFQSTLHWFRYTMWTGCNLATTFGLRWTGGYMIIISVWLHETCKYQMGMGEGWVECTSWHTTSRPLVWLGGGELILFSIYPPNIDLYTLMIICIKVEFYQMKYKFPYLYKISKFNTFLGWLLVSGFPGGFHLFGVGVGGFAISKYNVL